MTLCSEFTADFRSCVQGAVNLQYLMCLFGQIFVEQRLSGLTQWVGNCAY